MEPESSSFWSDIKKYEDTLAKDPQSYCFALLSELYRKLGLLDDALTVAKKGCEIHPEYVGGFMALGRAFYEKGMKEESRAALEVVVKGTPDNLLAQKLLSNIYIEAGETVAAENALRTILSVNPGDLESQVLLESLKRSATIQAVPPANHDAESLELVSTELFEGDETLEDEAILLDDLEIIEDSSEKTTDEEGELIPAEETVLAPELPEQPVASEEDTSTSWNIEEFLPGGEYDVKHLGSAMEEIPLGLAKTHDAPLVTSEKGFVAGSKDPLTTVTLAELYISQGFLKRAMAIYRELLDTDPENEDLRQKVVDLKLAIDRDESNARDHALEEEPVDEEEQVSSAEVPFVAMENEEETSAADSDKMVLATLETWLENIGRRRQ